MIDKRLKRVFSFVEEKLFDSKRNVFFNKETLLFIFFCFLFILLKLSSIGAGPRISDENLYFYAADLVSKGVLPYKDFFIANLPLQIVAYALVIKMFGFKLWMFKTILVLLTIGSSFILFKLISGKKGKRVGLFAAVFFLFSLIIIHASDFATGVHEATFFLLLSWYFLNRSPKMAGISLFIGLTFRRYIFPAALGLIVYQILKRRFKVVADYILFGFVPYILINVVFFYIFGESFLNAVWKYHLLKTSPSEKFALYSELGRWPSEDCLSAVI